MSVAVPSGVVAASTGTDWSGAAVSEAESFLATLDRADATALMKQGVPISFARGRLLVHEGQLPDRVLLLTSGRVKVVSAIADRELLLAFRGPGDLVGELSALDDAPRSATIMALERVEARSLTTGGFRTFLIQHPRASLVLLTMLSRRLRDSDAQRAELAVLTTIQRVAGRLLELSARFGLKDRGAIRLSLSQEELAGATGASLESVGRALQTMRALNCVETGRREIRILDADALDALRRATF